MAAVLCVWGLNALLLPLLRKVLHWYLGGQSLQNLHPLDQHSVLPHSSSSRLVMDGQSLHSLHLLDWIWMVSPSTAFILLTGYGWSVPPQPSSS